MYSAQELLSRLQSATEHFRQQPFSAEIGEEVWSVLEDAAVQMLNSEWAAQVSDQTWVALRTAWLELRVLVNGLEYSYVPEEAQAAFTTLQQQINNLSAEQIPLRGIPWWVYIAAVLGGLYLYTREGVKVKEP